MNRRLLTKLIGLIVIDIIIISSLFIFGVRSFNENPDMDKLFILLIALIAIKVIIYGLLSLYRFLLSHVGMVEVIRIVFAVIISNIIAFSLTKAFKIEEVNFLLFFYTTPLEILLITGVRFSKRIIKKVFHSRYFNSNNKYINTLIVGAGSAGKIAYDEIQKNEKLLNRVIAFIDDDQRKQNQMLNGLPVYGPISEIAKYIEKYNIKEVIIAIANIDRIRLSEILEIITASSVKVKRLPLLLEDVASGERKILDVKIEDLLNRGVIELDNKGLNKFIKNKVVLVTGAGGSIGSELCKQILENEPSELVLFDIYENTTYETQLELCKNIEDNNLKTKLHVLIGSVYNKERMYQIFNRFKPNLVFHAAAYKHVPLMEYSAHEAVRTNIVGTYNVASLANDFEVEKFILVSSDKAVRPTNIMGATKTACEHIIQYFDTISTTFYAAVRFGNVLGSHGSVVPIFKKQIENGGPVTITHPEITRFFMTIPEAVSLILQSGVYAKGGEIFILDMGEPVKIVDLADKMIRLSGLVPNKDIKIEFTGLRPGEKLFEELLLDVSKHHKTENNKIYIEEKREIKDIEKFIKLVKENLDVVSNHKMKELVQELVTTYKITTNN
ncbi:MAG TPA: polysaccharide biosynthesis protein [Acholeplasmataceae bacterium]|nr:polysaccharide biosynthesis protein [Acholeplasmataceae bacterium]